MVTKTLTLLLALLFAQSVWALDAKPHIVVNFEINATAFKLNLPQRATAQANIARDIAAQIAQRHAFIDWTLTPGGDPARLGALILKLEEEANTVPNPRIVIKWFGGADAASAKVLPIPAIEVYSPTNPNWDTNSRANFETRVLDKLRLAMDAQAFYDTLFKVFVRTLPIAKTVQASTTERAIDVPMNWTQLLVAPESVVVVHFRRTGDEGQLTLKPVVTRFAADAANPNALLQGAHLRGAVSAARVGIRDLSLVNNWNDQLPGLLRDAEVHCYLAEYKPLDFAGTLGNLVVNPNE